MEIVQLTASDYDEWLTFLNEVFGRINKTPMDFEKELPKMCVRDEVNMRKHIGVREKGKLCAVVGIYPLPARIAGIPVLFSTVGNVATHWECEGRGYMSKLLDCAMEQLDLLGADASRLSGFRQRYNRYGYESCGTVYQMTLTQRNRIALYPVFQEPFVFKRITRDDTEGLAYAYSLYRKNGIAVVRDAALGYQDMFDSLAAWRHTPYLVMRGDGSPVGYLSVSQGEDEIAEAGACEGEVLCEILCQWQAKTGKTLRFSLAPWRTEALRRLSAVCESVIIEAPNLFQIRNWEKITDALLKLKAQSHRMPEGELILEIREYGIIRLYVHGEEAGCVRTEKGAEICLDKLTASRFLFGPVPASLVPEAGPWAMAVLPLPLSWNLQDRV